MRATGKPKAGRTRLRNPAQKQTIWVEYQHSKMPGKGWPVHWRVLRRASGGKGGDRLPVGTDTCGAISARHRSSQRSRENRCNGAPLTHKLGKRTAQKPGRHDRTCHGTCIQTIRKRRPQIKGPGTADKKHYHPCWRPSR